MPGEVLRSPRRRRTFQATREAQTGACRYLSRTSSKLPLTILRLVQGFCPCEKKLKKQGKFQNIFGHRPGIFELPYPGGVTAGRRPLDRNVACYQQCSTKQGCRSDAKYSEIGQPAAGIFEIVIEDMGDQISQAEETCGHARQNNIGEFARVVAGVFSECIPEPLRGMPDCLQIVHRQDRTGKADQDADNSDDHALDSIRRREKEEPPCPVSKTPDALEKFGNLLAVHRIAPATGSHETSEKPIAI